MNLADLAGSIPPGVPEREFLEDVGAYIEARWRERGELCTALEAKARVEAGLRADIKLADHLAASHAESAASFEKAWREALAAPAPRDKWWAVTVGPYAGVEPDAEFSAGIAIMAGIKLWP